MNRRIHLALSAFLLSSFTPKAPPPNIVFILADDLGWADIKCNNPQSFYETPNIDKLAQSGVRFTQAYSAHPVCSPTRAAIMTGKHPNRLNITDWLPGSNPRDRKLIGPEDGSELALKEVTIAEKLKGKGYKTCFAGKWHLGHDEQFWPEHQGFGINIGGWSAGQPQINKGISNGYYSPYGNPRLKDGPEGEYLTDRLTDESIKFINENQDVPFFLYLAFYNVHTPVQASKKHITHFKQKREELTEVALPFKKEGEGWTKQIQDNAAHASMIAAMDENIGKIIQALEEYRLDENTWIIFTSDNGGRSTLYRKNSETSNTPLRAGKGWCYEGGIRVPLIIKGPKATYPGSTEDQPVISMDFFPTLLAIAGTADTKNDGEDLMPVLAGQGKIQRDQLFWHYPHYHGSAWTPGSALRNGDWKIVTFYEDNRKELYNLKNDPGETTDLAQQYPEKAAALNSLLNRKLKETRAQLPLPNKEYSHQKD